MSLDLDPLFAKWRIGEEVDKIPAAALAAHPLLYGYHDDRFLAITGHDLRAVADRFVDKGAEVGACILDRRLRTGSVMSSSIVHVQCSVISVKCTFLATGRVPVRGSERWTRGPSDGKVE